MGRRLAKVAGAVVIVVAALGVLGALTGRHNSPPSPQLTGTQYNVRACEAFDTWLHDQVTNVPVPNSLVDDVYTYGGKAGFAPIRTTTAHLLAHPKENQMESALWLGLYGLACNKLGLGPTDNGNLPGDLAACSSLNVLYLDFGAHKTLPALAELANKTVPLGKKAENASIRIAAQDLETASGARNNEAGITKGLQEYATACNAIGDWHGPK